MSRNNLVQSVLLKYVGDGTKGANVTCLAVEW